MSFRRVGVVMGGASGERDVSLASGQAVVEGLVEKGFDVVTIDLACNTRLFPLNPAVLFYMLAFNGAGTEASDVMVDGRFLRRDGAFTFLDEERIVARAHECIRQFSADYLAAESGGRALVRRVHADFRRS